MADKYTVVQHSGFGYAGKLEFRYGLETRAVTEPQAKKVKSVGGMVFDGYLAADAAAERWMYPPEVKGLAPNCRTTGTFANSKIDGLAIFIPTDAARQGVTHAKKANRDGVDGRLQAGRGGGGGRA